MVLDGLWLPVVVPSSGGPWAHMAGVVRRFAHDDTVLASVGTRPREHCAST